MGYSFLARLEDFSYILYKIIVDCSEYKIKGSETSQDEAGIAAYKTVELDESLGGGPVQYRELQGSESPLFMSYFKSSGGIEYLPGGVESGFKHVQRDVYETRLLHLKGKRTVRVQEVPLSTSSLNKGDVFILDDGLTIYIFNGQLANKYEKAKGIEVASHLNSDSRMGRANIVIVNDNISNPDFWGKLGGFVDPVTLPDGDSDDVVTIVSEPRLFKSANDNQAITFEELTLVGNKLSKSQLTSGDVFIVIGGVSKKAYIWVGKGASIDKKREAYPYAINLLNVVGLPPTTKIERVSEGSETSSFKSEFGVWSTPVSFSQLKSSRIAQSTGVDQEIDVNKLIATKAIEETAIDDGTGNLKIWVIQNFEKVPVPQSHYGQFHSGDSYILLYTYSKNRAEQYIIYFWLGNDSTVDEKASAALLSKELDDSFGGKPIQVRVTQGKEPSHFRQLFKGKLIIHAGGHASGFKNSNEQNTYDTDGMALFHVKGTNSLNTYGVQVPEIASSLNSQDAFVLVTPSHVFVWLGIAANDDELAVAVNIAGVLAGDYNNSGGREIVTVKEGQESDEFWAALGGKMDYSQFSPEDTALPRDARLFQASTASGSFRVDEIVNFDQSDLNDEDVFLLDTFTQVFVWIGFKSTQEEKIKAFDVARKFVTDANDGRDHDIPIITVHAGSEPTIFTSHFHVWDPDYIQKHSFLDPYQVKLQALNEEKQKKLSELIGNETVPAASLSATAVVKSGNSYSYDELKAGIPEGVDATKKEEYLDEQTFTELFKMDRVSFNALPKWKRDSSKKNLGLF